MFCFVHYWMVHLESKHLVENIIHITGFAFTSWEGLTAFPAENNYVKFAYLLCGIKSLEE